MRLKDKINVILIDDSKVFIERMKVILSKFLSYHLLNTCSNGKELVESPYMRNADLIIMDIEMPGMNGVEFIKKAKVKYPDKKFYILTGYEITYEIKQALDSGLINEYFSKPIEIVRMHRIIAEAVSS